MMPETLTLQEAIELSSKLPQLQQLDAFEAMVKEAREKEKMEAIDVCVQD